MFTEDIIVKNDGHQFQNDSNLVERVCGLIEMIYEKIRVSWVGKWINNWYKYIKEHRM